jgi:hypothetical protein
MPFQSGQKVSPIRRLEDLALELSSDGVKVQDSFSRVEMFLEAIPNQDYLLSDVFVPGFHEMMLTFFSRDERLKRPPWLDTLPSFFRLFAPDQRFFEALFLQNSSQLQLSLGELPLPVDFDYHNLRLQCLSPLYHGKDIYHGDQWPIIFLHLHEYFFLRFARYFWVSNFKTIKPSAKKAVISSPSHFFSGFQQRKAPPPIAAKAGIASPLDLLQAYLDHFFPAGNLYPDENLYHKHVRLQFLFILIEFWLVERGPDAPNQNPNMGELVIPELLLQVSVCKFSCPHTCNVHVGCRASRWLRARCSLGTVTASRRALELSGLLPATSTCSACTNLRIRSPITLT